VVEFFWHH